MKKIIGVILITIMMCMLSACDGKNSNVLNIDSIMDSPNSKLVDFEVIDYNYYEAILVDKNTKVMYIWLTTNCGGITPLYNPDGTLKLYEEQ